MSALIELVRRAAAVTTPYNVHDALQLIKALGELRLNRPEVRRICERASFSLASSPAEVSAASVVDAVNSLCKAQSSHLPVVRRALLRRFCELDAVGAAQYHRPAASRPSSAPPVRSANVRTAQKAAVVLAKVGHADGTADATEHVLRLLHTLLRRHADDAGLHTAYVALYANSARYAADAHWWRAPAATQSRLSVQTLVRSLTFLLRDAPFLARASGNVAWQLLHLLLLVPPSADAAAGAGTQLISGELCAAFDASLASGAPLRRMSAGAYVQFIHTCGCDVCRVDLRRACVLLSPLADAEAESVASAAPAERGRVRLNVYDATKLAGALADMMSVLATHPARRLPRPPAVLGQPLQHHEQHRLISDAMQSETGSEDTHEVWCAAARLCFSVLENLVEAEHARVCAPTSSGGGGLAADAVTSPDPFLVTALLDCVARAGALLGLLSATTSRAHDSSRASPPLLPAVPVLLELVPLLKDAPPTMLAWKLRSLASVWGQVRLGADDVGRLERAADGLLRRYLAVPTTSRSVRSDVEVLYAYARLAGPRSSTATGASAWEEEEEEETPAPTATVTPDASTAELQQALSLPPFAALDSIVRSIVPQLNERPAAAPALSLSDFDMLIAALLRLHARPLRLTAAETVPPHLHELHCAVAAHHCAVDEEPAAATSLRAARLYALASHVNRSPQLGHRAGAALFTAAARVGDDLASAAAAPLTSPLILRALAVLKQGTDAGAAAPLVLLATLCHRYQKHIVEVVRAGGPPDAVAGVVRVLRRARQAGVQLVFAEDVGGVEEGEDDIASHPVRSGTPALRFPAALVYLERLTYGAAADVLQLIAEVQLRSPAQVQLEAHVVPHLRDALLESLAKANDPECVIRLVESSRTASMSQLLFPHKKDLQRLARCVEACIHRLLRAAAVRGGEEAVVVVVETAGTGAPERHTYRQQASRLLRALARSHLIVRLPEAASGADGSGLRQCMLQLADYVSKSTHHADATAVLTTRLLCGGA